MTVAITSPSWSPELAPFLMADKLGYFGQEHLKVEYVLAKSGTEAVQQLIGGGVQIAVATPEPVVIAAQKNAGLQYFMPYYGHFIYQLAALEDSGITSVAGLKGKRIGVTNAASTGVTFLRTALAAAGLSEKDVTVVPIGVGAQQLSAIQQGRVDALAMWDTQYQTMANAGVATTIVPVPGMDRLFGGGLAARATDLARDQGLYERFGRALAKAYVYSGLHPEDVVKRAWEAQPETRPGPGQDKAKALADDARLVSARFGFLTSDPDSTAWTSMAPQQMSAFIDWAATAGLITSKPPVDAVLTDKLAPAIASVRAADLHALAP
ncbi:NrtA/SsuA/CpmA family ABC transporter substrate-binding protein [Amycolatopsis rhabdoformis]|uniref:NrtA/SsuA/CpmA family ABC transporter substrate-binding protein n=1 Tax=Amycolatopsis rhabdoformis TaxID=1448059 RepID=A0ABZ1IFZ1_9PSEU|nr:NrtA/SsuA/CpmA family ABC transporter substrate-binding protein [Amycolatopsis rhabdoformis]WSE32464.1 NrtA/SsuA/CpmA family ABC transporter substrate-binding protein [Amycolatopsis rhabdoformis]